MNPDEPVFPALRWDIFCRVVDNYGDIGVCWRLARNLAARGQQVRLWVDDATALQWMAPQAAQSADPGIAVLDWAYSEDASVLSTLEPADVWVEAFGCEIATQFIATNVHSIRARTPKDHKPLVWINLEYLSAEPYALRCHTLPSPVLSGPAAGWTKFFYPGFVTGSGGLLREPKLCERLASFDRAAWLAQRGIAWRGERVVSLFCYEPTGLGEWMQRLDSDAIPTLVLVAHGRSSQVLQNLPALSALTRLRPVYLPALSQDEFDHVLWASDLNCVRGEDSLVRALWAGKPLVWNIYPQSDGAHHAKLQAFLDWLDAPASLRNLHWALNGAPDPAVAVPMPALDLPGWQSCVQGARNQVLAQDDLSEQLIRLILKKR